MTVKSAVRVLNVFEHLSIYHNGLTIKEVSDQLEIPQSSTFHLMTTLLDNGYLSVVPGTKRYKLGAKLIQLGSVALEHFDFVQMSEPYLRDLMEKVDETVFMAILLKNELVYVSKISSNRSIGTTAQPGHRKPLYCTGLGKAFLAFMESDTRDKLLDELDLISFTPQTITDKDILKNELIDYEKQGYAVDNEENEEGLYCIAAPVYQSNRSLIATISVAGPKERMLRQHNKIVKEITKKSCEISQMVYY